MPLPLLALIPFAIKGVAIVATKVAAAAAVKGGAVAAAKVAAAAATKAGASAAVAAKTAAVVKTGVMVAEGAGIAGVAVASYNQHQKAKAEESEALRLASRAQEISQSAQKTIEARRTDLKAHLLGIQETLRVTHEQAVTRAQPIMERYAGPLTLIEHWAMPPGFDVIEHMEIVPLPASPVSWDVSKKAVSEVASSVSRAMYVGGHHGGGAPDLSSAGVMAGVALLSSGFARRAKAETLLTEVAKYEAKARELSEEANGLSSILHGLKGRADTVAEKMRRTSSFFGRYIRPCEELYHSGLSWEQFDEEDRRQVQYLASVLACMTRTAEEPLA